MTKTKTYLTSTHWGSYETVTKDGKLIRLEPFERDQDPSPIGHGIIGVIDDQTRIKTPMARHSWLLEKRQGIPSSKESRQKRGKDAYVPISWDEAIALAGDELGRVIKDHGNSAIYAGSYGWASAGRFHHAQSQIHRFLNTIGGYTKSVNTYSFAAAEVIFPHVVGDFRGFLYHQTSWPSIIENTELFVAFGGVAIKNAQIGQGGVGVHSQKQWMLEAHQKGVEFVNISPLQDDIIKTLGATWHPIRPNTDTALMLALCYVLIDENLHDQDFIERYTTGFDQVSAYIKGDHDGQPKSPEWAALICDIPAQSIRDLARLMASKRTMISFSWSLSRQAHGEQPLWAGVTLAAMLGQIGLAGGGFGFGFAAVHTVGNCVDYYDMVAMPQGENPVRSFIPVARVADMLLNPGGSCPYNGQDLTFPDIRLVYWAGGNPFHHHQDLNRLRKAWQCPETVIVHEWCWNALAKHADLILPCTTSFERQDIAMSPRDPYVMSMEKAIEPIGDSRDDFDIFAAIGRHMGVEDQFTEGRTSEEWQRYIYDETQHLMTRDGFDFPDYDEFRKKRWFVLKTETKPKVLFEDFRRDPETHRLKTPSGKIELYSSTIAGFGYDDAPPHAAWIEPPEWLGQDDPAYPLHLLCNQPKAKLHSQLDHGTISRAAKIKGHEGLYLNPNDASKRGIAEGDLVRVFNNRGDCLCGAIITSSIRPGVVLIPTGAWFDPDDQGDQRVSCKHGNPNVLTPDRGTSKLAQGPAAHSCLVDIEKWQSDDLTITAFDPPKVVTTP